MNEKLTHAEAEALKQAVKLLPQIVFCFDCGASPGAPCISIDPHSKGELLDDWIHSVRIARYTILALPTIRGKK